MTNQPQDQVSTPDLIKDALNSDEDISEPAIYALHMRGSRDVLDQALALSKSCTPTERATAADILGQIGVPKRTFPEQCFRALIDLLEDDDLDVLFSAISALRHIDNELAAPFVLNFTAHTDDDIRFAVAVALGGVNTPEAIAALTKLTGDCSTDVRDWATFGLGQLCEADSLEIREALAARLGDPDPDVFDEAIYGLARRRDMRALSYIKGMLHNDPENYWAHEAAAMMLGIDDPHAVSNLELLGGLQKLQRWVRRL